MNMTFAKTPPVYPFKRAEKNQQLNKTHASEKNNRKTLQVMKNASPMSDRTAKSQTERKTDPRGLRHRSSPPRIYQRKNTSHCRKIVVGRTGSCVRGVHSGVEVARRRMARKQDKENRKYYIHEPQSNRRQS
jgi:hypothetical protein